MFAGRRFQFRPVLTLCAGLGLAVLVSLGLWQLHRLEWKRALIAKVEARVAAAPVPYEDALARAQAGEDMEYTPVSLRGALLADRSASVFGMLEATAGVYVFAPVRVDGDDYVYVNLGFVLQTASAPIGNGAVELEGLLRYAEKPSPPASWFQPNGKSADGLWFVRDPKRFADEAGLAASGFYIDRFAAEGGGWPKGGTTRLDFRNNHLDYALTWFGLAAVLFAVWLIFSLPKYNSSNNFKK